jgi:hypothetical protein
MLQTGIIKFKTDDNNFPALPGVQFKQQLQYFRESLIFFFVIAVPLTALTLAVWYILDQRYQKLLKQKPDEENACSR